MRKLIISMAIAGVMAGSAVTGTVFADPFSNPSDADCHGAFASSLAKEFGGLKAAAEAFGFDSVKDLQDAIAEECAENGNG